MNVTSSIETLCYRSTVIDDIVDTLCYSATVIDDTEDSGQALADMNDHDWRVAQGNDAVLQFWLKVLRNRQEPRKSDLPNGLAHLNIFKTFSHLKMERGVLYRHVKMKDEVRRHIPLPQTLVQAALQSFHDDIGHQGKERTYSLLQERFNGLV